MLILLGCSAADRRPGIQLKIKNIKLKIDCVGAGRRSAQADDRRSQKKGIYSRSTSKIAGLSAPNRESNSLKVYLTPKAVLLGLIRTREDLFAFKVLFCLALNEISSCWVKASSR